MHDETKARQLGLNAAISAICDYADRLARSEFVASLRHAAANGNAAAAQMIGGR